MNEAEIAAAMFPSATPAQPESAPHRASGLTGSPKTAADEKSLADRMFPGKAPEKIDRFKDLKPSWAREAEPREGEKPKPDAKERVDGTDAKGEAEAKAGEPLNVIEHAEDLGLNADDPLLGDFQSLADDLKLSKDDAQKLVEFDQQRTAKVWDQIGETWLTEAKTSRTFDLDVSAAKGLLRDHGDEAFMELIENFRLGNNPAVIKLLGAVGRRLGYR